MFKIKYIISYIVININVFAWCVYMNVDYCISRE